MRLDFFLQVQSLTSVKWPFLGIYASSDYFLIEIFTGHPFNELVKLTPVVLAYSASPYSLFSSSGIFQGAPLPVLKCGLGGMVPGRSPWNVGLTDHILQSTMISLRTCDPSQPIPGHWDSILWLLLKLLGKESPLFWRSCEK